MSLGVPRWAQDQSYSASAARLQQSAQSGVGVVNPGDMVVTQGSGSQMTIAAGQANVRQTVQTEGTFYAGIYQVANDAPANPYNTVSAPAANPRIDLVIMRIYDAAEQGIGGSSFARFEWVVGTESSTATLDSRSGAAALPANSLLLADVLITTGSVQTIRDRRPLASQVVPPSTKSAVVAEQLIPFTTSSGAVTPGSGISAQTAAAGYLPRPIAATKVRWMYGQGATALTGNWNIGIYDASGRLIVSTGSTAFAGAASSTQVVTATITQTVIEAGMYYAVFGYASSSVGSITTSLAHASANGVPIPVLPNQVLGVAAGGTLLPPTLPGAMADLCVAGAIANSFFAPIVGVSVA